MATDSRLYINNNGDQPGKTKMSAKINITDTIIGINQPIMRCSIHSVKYTITIKETEILKWKPESDVIITMINTYHLSRLRTMSALK